MDQSDYLRRWRVVFVASVMVWVCCHLSATGQDVGPAVEMSYVGGDINNLALQQWRNEDKTRTDDMCLGDKILQWEGQPLVDTDDLVRRWLDTPAGSVTHVLVERAMPSGETTEVRQMEVAFTHPVPSVLFGDSMVGGRKVFRSPDQIHPDWESLDPFLKQTAVESLAGKAPAVIEALDSAFARHLQVVRDHYRSDHVSYLLQRPFHAETWARHYLDPAVEATTPKQVFSMAWKLAEPQSRPLPDDWITLPISPDASFDQCVIILEERMAVVDQAWSELLAELTSEERQKLIAWLKAFQPVWRDEPGWTEFVEGMQITKKIAPEKLAHAVALSGMLLNDIVPGGTLFDRLKATMADIQPGKHGASTTVLGSGPDQTTIKSAITIDLGGDDAIVFANNPEPGGTRIVIDFGGDDIYIERGGSIASGVGAASFVVNAGGNDAYLGGTRSCGFGLLGVGVLWDVDGHDTYRNSIFSQGTGCLGIGLLADQSGNDRYEASSYSQAVGLTAGCGMVLDRDGDDVYICTGKDESPYGDAGEYAGWGQGCGFGFRSAGAGGVGALIDLSGRDFYRAGQFGLGCGYYFGIGIVHDRSGDDVYECSRYGLASGAHYAVGIVLDDAGRDSYLALRSASVATLGSTWDLCLGLLVDSAGDDVYQGEAYALGGAAQTAYGFFWDKQGRDVYRSSGGSGIEAAGYIGGASYGGGRLARNLAIFIDEGAADDEYRLPQRENNARGVHDEFGVWVDR